MNKNLRTIPFGRKQAPVPLHEIPHPQNPAGLLQLRRVYSRRRRTYRVADQSELPRPEHVEPAVIHTRQLDARGAGPARTRRFVRLHPDDVQRGGNWTSSRSPRSSRSAIRRFPWRCSPPSRRTSTAASRNQDRSGLDYIFGWHGNTDLIMAIIKLVEDKMNAEGYRRGRRAGHSAGRGLDPLLLDLPARTLQS